MTRKSSGITPQATHTYRGTEVTAPDGCSLKPLRPVLESPLYPLSFRGMIRHAVSSLAPVFISGERGTRKRALARGIHLESLQKDMPFITVPAERFQEEMRNLLLRGEELGGTLYLSGIESLPDTMRGVLDDYLESGEMSLEGVKRAAALRLIVTSETEPGNLAAESPTMRTLLHRLSIIELDIPPLRARRAEVPAIAEYLRDQVCHGYRLKKKEISPETQRLLTHYDWPDNIDEMEGVIGRGLVASADEIIMPWHLTISPRFGVEESGSSGVEELERSEPKVSNSSTPELRNSPSSLALRLAHEIKNPLVSIKTYANLLEDKFSDEEFRREFYQVMKRDVEKIDRVVEEILSEARNHTAEARNHPDVNKGETSETAGGPGEADLNILTESLLGELRDELARKKVAVFKYLSDEVSGVPVDNGQFRTAMGGILLSILEHIQDGGDLYVSTARKTVTGQYDEGKHSVEIVMEGCPLLGGLDKFGADTAWQEKIMKSQGAHVDLRESEGGGVSVTVNVQMQPEREGVEDRSHS